MEPGFLYTKVGPETRMPNVEPRSTEGRVKELKGASRNEGEEMEGVGKGGGNRRLDGTRILYVTKQGRGGYNTSRSNFINNNKKIIQ